MSFNITDRVKVINVEPFPEEVQLGDIAKVENFGRWEESYIIRFTNGLRCEIPAENVHKYLRKLRLPKQKVEDIVHYDIGDEVVFMDDVITCPQLSKGELGHVNEITNEFVFVDFGNGKIEKFDKDTMIIKRRKDLKW